MTQAAYAHNGRPVERGAFYAIACDPRRSIAVEACAGAGKTWMLVSRILRALLEGSLAKDAVIDGKGTAAHEILAITFTKKAAGEMRQRLNEWLVEFAQATPEKLAAELLARGVPPAQIARQVPALKNLYPQLLASARPVQIRTFHSWFAALLRTAPLVVLQDLGLPANYSLLEDDTEAVRAVWPDHLPLTARLGADDFNPDGVKFEDSIQVVRWLKEHGLDMIDLSMGGNTDDVDNSWFNEPASWVERAIRLLLSGRTRRRGPRHRLQGEKRPFLDRVLS